MLRARPIAGLVLDELILDHADAVTGEYGQDLAIALALGYHGPMPGSSLPPRGEDTIEASVTIGRPVGEVFGFYRNFKNLPSFLGDVMAIEQTGPATSRWTIQGPLGIRANWTIRVTQEQSNELIRSETASLLGLRTSWEVHFAPASGTGETKVREVMRAPLGGLRR